MDGGGGGGGGGGGLSCIEYLSSAGQNDLIIDV